MIASSRRDHRPARDHRVAAAVPDGQGQPRDLGQPGLASASGIDVEQVINRVWIIGATLAALGGIIYSLNNGVNWIQGFQILLLVFAGVIVGGLGTAFGALVGSPASSAC